MRCRCRSSLRSAARWSYVWFARYDESAVIAANFLVSSIVLIPGRDPAGGIRPPSPPDEPSLIAILLLLIGTLAASAAGRVFYQAALTATHDDNGYVTMFFLTIPVLSSLLSWPLSRWIADLRFFANPTFFAGMALVTGPLLLFSWATWRRKHPGGLRSLGLEDELPVLDAC